MNVFYFYDEGVRGNLPEIFFAYTAWQSCKFMREILWRPSHILGDTGGISAQDE